MIEGVPEELLATRAMVLDNKPSDCGIGRTTQFSHIHRSEPNPEQCIAVLRHSQFVSPGLELI